MTLSTKENPAAAKLKSNQHQSEEDISLSLIPARFLDTVVAIGNRRVNSSIEYTATGFVYQVSVRKDKGDKLYASFIVTNRHVIKDTNELYTRQNHPSGVNVVGRSLEGEWTVHPDPEIDVAVRPFHIPETGGAVTSAVSFYSDTDTMLRKQLINAEFREGNEVFILGFPLSQIAEDKNYVITRQGIIARIQDWYDEANKSFLIDASIFPGNSGGPVLAKPTLHTYGSSITTAKLIGMVSGYFPYRDIARSDQTGDVVFASEENSGLGIVVPLDAIEETVRIVVDRHREVEDPYVPVGEV